VSPNVTRFSAGEFRGLPESPIRNQQHRRFPIAEKPKLGELLVMAGAIDQTQLGSALADQRKFGKPLGSILVSMGYIDEETLVRSLARQLNLPIAWLRDKWVESEVLELVPAKIAIKHHCLPLLMSEDAGGKVLHLAMQDPGNLEAVDAVSFQVGHKVTPVLAAASELEDAIQRHYQSGDTATSAPSNRPEVQNVPELLMFELKAQAATPVEELAFEFGTGPGDAALMSSQAVLTALTQLLSVLIEKGIISKEEVAARLRPFI
jgi:type IV pilus assembly protein PilB